jgi:sugar/nucleoside kinase (ribokinase family)
MKNPMSILCVGQLAADIVVRPVDALPVAGHADLVTDLELLAGGCAANTASVLAKFGVPVALLAVIGRDALGDAVLADLAAVGVQTDLVVREPKVPTSAAIVLANSGGERSFFYRTGGNEQLANRHIPDAALEHSAIVHVGGAMKLVNLDLAELTRRAKSFGCRTSLDTDWDAFGSWMQRLHGALPQIDFLMTNAEEAAMLTGRQDSRAAAESLLAQGPEAVLVKRGACGSLLATRAGMMEFSAFQVEVFDTTCAGDAAAAGFLLGVSQGLPVEESARLANAAGALCTTQLSHHGIVSLEQARRFIATQSSPSPPLNSA